jgi:hypothetical protein
MEQAPDILFFDSRLANGFFCRFYAGVTWHYVIIPESPFADSSH